MYEDQDDLIFEGPEMEEYIADNNIMIDAIIDKKYDQIAVIAKKSEYSSGGRLLLLFGELAARAFNPLNQPPNAAQDGLMKKINEIGWSKVQRSLADFVNEAIP